MSYIKIERALRLANFDPSSEAARFIMNGISTDVINSVSSRLLASIIISMDVHWHQAQAAKEDEIIEEGCVWSRKEKKLIELDR